MQNIEKSIRTQLRSRNVGYLFGAWASYLNGAGFPLSFTIWDVIKNDIPEDERDEIQAKLEEDGTEGLEHALDLLDPGGPEPIPMLRADTPISMRRPAIFPQKTFFLDL